MSNSNLSQLGNPNLPDLIQAIDEDRVNAGLSRPVALMPNGNEVLVLHKDFKAIDTKELMAQWEPRPTRRSGDYKMGRDFSFIQFVNRFKSADSVVYGHAEISGKTASVEFTAVLNEHPEGDNDGMAGHGDFRVSYYPKVSKELLAWLKNDGDMMGQGDFARFVEDHVHEMADPFMLGEDAVGELGRTLTGKGADPINMLEISRGIEANVDEQVKSSLRLASGEVQVQYTSEHKDSSGQPLKLPSWFLIRLPVFQGGEPVIIPVRFRYRITAGSIKYGYELFRIEQTFDKVFDDLCKAIADGTELPLFIKGDSSF